MYSCVLKIFYGGLQRSGEIEEGNFSIYPKKKKACYWSTISLVKLYQKSNVVSGWVERQLVIRIFLTYFM